MAKIRAKVMAVARFNRMLSNAKMASLEIAQYKLYSTDGKLPKGLLLKHISEIKNDVNQFLAVRNLDAVNEKMPTAKAEEVHVRRASLKGPRPKMF
jgi:hypothetical protein